MSGSYSDIGQWYNNDCCCSVHLDFTCLQILQQCLNPTTAVDVLLTSLLLTWVQSQHLCKTSALTMKALQSKCCWVGQYTECNADTVVYASQMLLTCKGKCIILGRTPTPCRSTKPVACFADAADDEGKCVKAELEILRSQARRNACCLAQHLPCPVPLQNPEFGNTQMHGGMRSNRGVSACLSDDPQQSNTAASQFQLQEGQDEGLEQGQGQGDMQGRAPRQGERQGQDQRDSWGHRQGQAQEQGNSWGQSQGHGDSWGQKQGQGQDQRDSWGQRQAQGQGQGDSWGQRQGQGQEQGQSSGEAELAAVEQGLSALEQQITAAALRYTGQNRKCCMY